MAGGQGSAAQGGRRQPDRQGLAAAGRGAPLAPPGRPACAGANSSSFGSKGTIALAAALHGAAHLSAVRVLDLSGNPMDQGAVRALGTCLQAASHLAQLRELHLSRISRSCATDFHEVWQALRTPHLSGLRSLGLAGNQRRADLVAGLRGLKHLASLDISRNALLDAGSLERLAKVLAAMTNLRSLDVARCGLHNNGFAGLLVAELGRAIGVAQLTRLCLDGNRVPVTANLVATLSSRTRLAGLQELSCRACFVPGELDAPKFLQLLTRMTALRRLDLRDNGLGWHLTSRSIAEMLSLQDGQAPRGGMGMLQVLLLGGNSAGRLCFDAEALVRAIGELPHLASLTELDVSACGMTAKFLAEVLAGPALASLRVLDISRNALGEEGEGLLASALRVATHLSGLRCLRASGPGMGSGRHLALAVQEEPHLQQLELHLQ